MPPARGQQRLAATAAAADPVIETAIRLAAAPPILSYDGISNADNEETGAGKAWPSNASGDIGPNHYVQWVNRTFAVWDRDGNLLSGPTPGNALWEGVGGPCVEKNDGAPQVVYDQLADRWVFSQPALDSGVGHQCFAISQTSDPLGPYYLYDYIVAPSGLNDSPRLAVWPDAYYLTFNEYVDQVEFTSAVAVAFDRQSMILGLRASSVKFDVKTSNPNDIVFSVQPSHLEGLLPPPTGAPNFIVQAFDDEIFRLSNVNAAADEYHVWAFHTDWTDPGAATLTGPVTLTAPEFDSNLCDFAEACIPQPEGPALEALSHFTSYRVAYRDLGDHEALVVNHTVDVGGDRAGIRWAEIRNPSSMPALFQTGTYAPDDGLSRWVGSIAMDGSGNIGLAYSVANASTFPGLRYAARTAADAPGTMGQGEAVLVAGGSSQAQYSRWGSTFALSVDELDQCTFWFTGQYGSSANPGDWSTRISSFKLPECSASTVGTISGSVTDSAGDPIPGALVAVGSRSTVTGIDGAYTLVLLPGTYDVTVSVVGFQPKTAAGIVVAGGASITLDFTLEEAPAVTVSGYVLDDDKARWPLYAALTFRTEGAEPLVVYTDPETGWYEITLVAGVNFTVSVHSLVPGYIDESRPITPVPGGVTAHFALDLAATCAALGYARTFTSLLTEKFDGTFPPAGWTVAHTTTGCAGTASPQWTGDPTRTNRTGGTGTFAIADSDRCGPGSTMSTTLTSPPIDLSSFGTGKGIEIAFNQDLFWLAGTHGIVEIWNGTAWVVVTDQIVSSRTQRVSFGTSAGNGRADARIRFRFVTAGWLWWWQIDNLEVFSTSCEARLGGLLTGFVSDDFGGAVNGAKVQVGTEAPTMTFATLEDRTLPDGMYVAFAPGPGPVTASKLRFASQTKYVIPEINGIRRVDFKLGVGRIVVSSPELAIRVPIGETRSAKLTVTNTGSVAAKVDLADGLGLPNLAIEDLRVKGVPGRSDPFQLYIDPKFVDEYDASKAIRPEPRNAELLAAGEVVARFASGRTFPWALSFDGTGVVWISDLKISQGDDKLHKYLIDGTYTRQTIDIASYSAPPSWGADLAFDGKMLWQVRVGAGAGTDLCIYESNPLAKVVTGNKICPPFETSERGLAYDPVSDTFYAGSWNDRRIVQFDRSGTILRSINVDLLVSGLAYNPVTGHLFAITNSLAADPDITVFDAATFRVVGQIEIKQNGIPVFGSVQQAGLELDCDGMLWAVNQVTKEVIVAESGEQSRCIGQDVPWLSITPDLFVLQPGVSAQVQITIKSRGITPGLLDGHVKFRTDTPFDVASVPLRVIVAFYDVAEGSFGEPEIHGMAGAGISWGSGGGNFSPLAGLTRATWAVWALRSRRGATYVPPRATGLVFRDVSPEAFGADYIEDAYTSGILDACGEEVYCPDSFLSRRDTAISALKARYGATYVPPAPVGRFADVAPADARWVEDIVAKGVMEPCGVTTFCPNRPQRRADLAIVLVRLFGFRTYPPQP